MGILTEGLPDSITVEGKKYAVNTDFRVWIKFGEMMSSAASSSEKLFSAIVLCFDKDRSRQLPSDPAAALEALCDFYACGKLNSGGKKPGRNRGGKKDRVFSFSEDWGYIYAAFLSEYGMDLFSERLHWYQFMALLESLSEESRFMKILAYRTVQPENTADSARRKFLRRMKRLYSLPDNRTEEEKEAELADKLSLLF